MPRPALEVADIFRDHGAAWRAANAGHVSLGQLQVMSALYGDSSVKLLNANSHLLLVQPIDSGRLLERPEGSPPLGAKHRAATLYAVGSARDPDHEAVIRFSGEAPRRRAHSADGIEAMELFGVTATSARHRRPVTKARPDVEQGASTPRRPKPLRP